MVTHKKLTPVINLAVVLRLGLMLSLLLPMLAMAAQQPAGFVLMAKGDVFAVQPDQQQRLLKRKSPFYSGESLKTGQNAKAQLRFRDGSLISMRADTEIRIDEFRFQGADKADDRNIFTLVSGGFRTITGKIGKKNPKNYQMKSAVASIGVRGTTYEVVIDDGLNVAAWQGTIVVENEMGHITLGAEGVFNFARIASPVIEPKGLMNPPAVIAAPAPVKAEVADKKDAPKARPSQRRSIPEQVAALESAPEPEVGQRIEPNAEPKVEPGFDPGFEPQAEQVFVANVELSTEQGLEPSFEANVDPEFDPVTDGRIDSVIQAADDSGVDAEPPVLVDSRVGNLVLDRLAMAVVAGEGVEGMFAGGKAGLDADGKLHIADNGLSPAEAGFDSEPFVRVLTQGTAPMLLSESMLIDANHRLEWGIWQATAAAPAQLQTDAADSGIYTAINRPVYWGTATATSAEAMGAQTGVASYKNVLGFIGSGNSGAIDDMYVNLALNFDTAAVEGLASIYTPAESWYLSLSGAIDGPVLNISSVSGEVNGNAVQGEFNSLFTGDAAQAVVSSFDFESVLDPALHVEGLVVVDNAAGPDLRLKNINLDRLGMYQYVDAVAGVEGFVGLAGNDAGNNLFFAANGLEPGQAGFLTAPVTSLLSQGSASETALFADTVFAVSWGVWDGTVQPAVMAISADDPRLTQDVSRRVRWLTLEPSSATAIAAKTGSVAYDNVIAFDAAGSGGVVQELLINLGVNFDTGNVVGDVDLQTPGNGLWQAAFSGVIAGPGFSADSVSGFYNSDLAINGQFAAAFTGANADAMAGMFSFERVDNPAVYVDGAFLLDGNSVADPYLAGVTLDKTGLLFVSGLGVTQSYQGRASDGAGGAPVITDNGLSLNDIGYDSTAPLSVFRNTGQSLTPASLTSALQTFVLDPAHSVSWGRWQGDVSPAYLYEKNAGSTVVTDINTPVYWSTLDLPDVSLPGAGVSRYSNVLGFVGEGQGGSVITNIYMDLGVDLTTAEVNGQIHIYTADAWYLDVAGSFSSTGPMLALSITGGEFNFTPGLSGYVDAAFAGASGDALLGVFDIEQSGNPDNFVEGMFLVDNTPRQDVRLSAAQQASIDRVGLVVKANATPGADVIVGGATPGSDPLFAFNGLVPMEASYSSTPFLQVVSRNGVTEQQAPSSPRSDVVWGIWDVGSLWKLSSFDADPAQQQVVNDPLLWMTVLPTADAVMDGIILSRGGSGGAAFYASVDSNFGLYNAGPLAFHNNYLSVDFDTAKFAGRLNVEDSAVSANVWEVFYSGNISGAHLDVTSYDSSFFNNTATAINSNIVLSFVGTNAEAVAGAFDLELASDPSVYALGGFVAGVDSRFSLAQAASMDRVGLISSEPLGAQLALSSSGLGGTPVFGLNGEPLGSDAFKLFTFTDVLSVGGALTTNSSVTIANSADFEVNWGVWDGTGTGTGTTYTSQTDPADAGVVSPISNILRWLTVIATPDTAIAARSGSVIYDSPIGFDAGGNKGTATLDSFTATMNFDTANLTAGALNFSDAGGTWGANFNGSLGQGGEIIVPNATISGFGAGSSLAASTSSMKLVLTGPNAEALAGSYKLTNTAADYSSGVFVICQNGGGC